MRTRVTDLFRIDRPIVQAPMAGANGSALAIAVAGAGGLGSIPCAMLSPDGIRDEVAAFRAATSAPLNLNFFCHAPPVADPQRDQRWLALIRGYDIEWSVQRADAPASPARLPFDASACLLVEQLRPEVVSFHFGLPDAELLGRVVSTGALVVSSATTVVEARWLQAHGCAAVIAQGSEAGGHRGMFLTDDISAQVGTMALVPRVVDAVDVPVIAAGGIGDARGVAAAFALGADAVQVGTAYLLCPEALTTEVHRRALQNRALEDTVLTNVFTGRPARSLVNRAVRELGPMNDEAPAFPRAGAAMAPLRAAAEAAGSGEFSPLWSGQAGVIGPQLAAAELTQRLMAGVDTRE